MYRLSDTTDFEFLLGQEVVQVCVGKFQTVVNFDGGATLTIEGSCMLGNDRYGPGVEAGRQLITLLGRMVASVSALEQQHLEVAFGDGTVVTVLGEDDNFESFTLAGPHGLIVV